METVSLITSVAACLSAIAALVVVRQNYKQRVASYRPTLVLVETPVTLPSFEKTGGLPDLDEAGGGRISMPLVNIGLGAARQLRVTWRFPIGQVTSTVNRLAQESLTPVYFVYENDFLSKKSDRSDSEWLIRWHKETNIDFVLPASTHKAPTSLELPLAYVALFSAVYYFAFKRGQDKPSSAGVSIPDIPPLECRLEFADIGDGKHSVDLSIRIDLAVLSTEEFRGILTASRRGGHRQD